MTSPMIPTPGSASVRMFDDAVARYQALPGQYLNATRIQTLGASARGALVDADFTGPTVQSRAAEKVLDVLTQFLLEAVQAVQMPRRRETQEPPIKMFGIQIESTK